MKRLGFLIGVFILFSLGFVSAISSDLKEMYSPRESIIIELFGSIVKPIDSSQVKLLRGHVEVAFDYDIKKLGERYFVWLNAPNNVENYTLVIEDIIAVEDGTTQLVDYRGNFSVQGESVDYNVKPGVILTTKDFEIDVKLYEDFNKEISVNFPETRSVALKPGSNNIEFSIDNVEGIKFVMVNVGRYNVPAYIRGGDVSVNGSVNNGSADNNGSLVINESVIINESEDNEEIIFPEIKEKKFRFNPGIIESKVLLNEVPKYSFSIYNEGPEVIDDLTFDYNRNLFSLNSSNASYIGVNESRQFELSIKEFPGEVRDVIIARSGEEFDYLIVKISSVDSEDEVSTDYLKDNSENKEDSSLASPGETEARQLLI